MLDTLTKISQENSILLKPNKNIWLITGRRILVLLLPETYIRHKAILSDTSYFHSVDSDILLNSTRKQRCCFYTSTVVSLMPCLIAPYKYFLSFCGESVEFSVDFTGIFFTL
jgi:hypothetical protein